MLTIGILRCTLEEPHPRSRGGGNRHIAVENELHVQHLLVGVLHRHRLLGWPRTTSRILDPGRGTIAVAIPRFGFFPVDIQEVSLWWGEVVLVPRVIGGWCRRSGTEA